jgi:hypothetical protein
MKLNKKQQLLQKLQEQEEAINKLEEAKIRRNEASLKYYNNMKAEINLKRKLKYQAKKANNTVITVVKEGIDNELIGVNRIIEPIIEEIKPVEAIIKPEIKPVEPVMQVEPVKAIIEEIKPVEPVMQVEPLMQVKAIIEEIKPVEPVEPVKAIIEEIKPVEPVEAIIKPVEPVMQVEPVEANFKPFDNENEPSKRSEPESDDDNDNYEIDPIIEKIIEEELLHRENPIIALNNEISLKRQLKEHKEKEAEMMRPIAPEPTPHFSIIKNIFNKNIINHKSNKTMRNYKAIISNMKTRTLKQLINHKSY